ncbi:MAG: DUF5110 domain-containing protein, partial [Asgard group archaeon]|nr:DUF5110 domain-containing protein [Asgard group archaeon]
IPLDDGVISRDGWSVIDDSNSLVFTQDGWIESREKSNIDWYFFGYGGDYQACLDDYLKLGGEVPLIPRWMLGNWWSRYWEYTQKDVKHLVNEFKEHDVPLSIFIIDMDWHITNVKEYWKKPENRAKISKKIIPPVHDGWTGFTWNEELFPDYKELLVFLREKNVRTALNLHPATGVYPHEIQYSKIANRMGYDQKTCKQIKFDIANQKFAQAYFEEILHPYQRDGVDFWWTDWQQGKKTKLPGLDPLWWLNHLHFEDMSSNLEKRPIVFSRWGGLGNQRYPIGFSGDTYVTWESLAFQPYFTSTAANVGYFWWSHDIGGHMGGAEDAELYSRWIQYGCFSPILRLHSTKNPYMIKLPWKFDDETFSIVRSAMQLRHQLIPYIYSIAWLSYTKNIPLCQPLYYLYPSNEFSYSFRDQYFFGTELLVAPIIAPMESSVGISRKEIWLPEGQWFDFNTGEYFFGNRILVNYYSKRETPIFAKAGAIIPISSDYHHTHLTNPEVIQLLVFPGSNNQFVLFEDDGVSQKYKTDNFTQTEIKLESTGKLATLEVNPTKGDSSLIPNNRQFEIILKGVNEPTSISVTIDTSKKDAKWSYDKKTRTLKIEQIQCKPKQKLHCQIKHTKELINQDSFIEEKLYSVMRSMQIPYNLKTDVYKQREKLITEIKSLHESIKTVGDIPKDVVSSHNSDTVIQLIAFGYILSAIQPELFELSSLKKMLNKASKKELKRLIERFSLLYSGKHSKEIFPLTKSQLQAIIETITQQPLLF